MIKIRLFKFNLLTFSAKKLLNVKANTIGYLLSVKKYRWYSDMKKHS